MPELPEVETTLRGIAPYLLNQRIDAVIIREHRLRWPIPDELPQLLTGQTILRATRRAKYLLFTTDAGTLMVHLGMSGSLRILVRQVDPGKHDHVDIVLAGGTLLRYRDPRRFGSILWLEDPVMAHPLLRGLGPEPLADDFDAAYLYRRSRSRQTPVKNYLMDGRVVVGVGNIYANEALFMAGIDPRRAAGRISRPRYQRLVNAVREVLATSIEQGGTTLRDFTNEAGDPGYFRQSLRVYGRAGKPCIGCGRSLHEVRLAQRTTVFCPCCQR